ncbi:MAG TPA: hypothetical protein VN045_02535 [Microbacteriaceae bacterium]|nr:hypothetical protein [Microbacteriaceae bacterium]
MSDEEVPGEKVPDENTAIDETTGLAPHVAMKFDGHMPRTEDGLMLWDATEQLLAQVR